MHSYGRALKETVAFGASAGVSSGGDSLEASTGDDNSTPPVPAPAPVDTPASPPAAADVDVAVLTEEGECPERYHICVSGAGAYYGAAAKGVGLEYPEKPGGISIFKDGDGWKCELEEYAGGFDGFPSPEVDDDHEVDLDEAVKKLLPHGKHTQDCFLQKLVEVGQPLDMDYPEDEAKADNGKRMENIGKLNAACTSLLYFDDSPDCSASAPTAAHAEASGDSTHTETHTDDGSSTATAFASGGGEGGDGGDGGLGSFDLIEPVEGPLSVSMGPESDMGPAASPEDSGIDTDIGYDDLYADDDEYEVFPGPRVESNETVSGTGTTTASGTASGDETSVFVSTSRRLASWFRQIA